MDPTESEKVCQTLAAQGSCMEEYKQVLHNISGWFGDLRSNAVTSAVTALAQVEAQLSSIKLTNASSFSTAPVPAPPAAVASPYHLPREPFIPNTARYSGDIKTCLQFLHSYVLVLD